MIDGEDIYAPERRPGRRSAAWSGMVFQSPNPFPTMSIYENVAAGLKLNARKMKKSDMDEIVERSLRGAHLWDEVKDRLDKPGLGPLRRPAAAALHRPRDRGRARGAADGRAVLGARPDRDARDRGPDPGAEEQVHDRDRHPQHAAGEPRERLHGVLQPREERRSGPARRDRRDREDLLQPRRRRRPRTTSAAGSDDEPTRRSALPGGARPSSRSGRSAASTSSSRRSSRTLEAIEHSDIELAEMVIADDDRIDGRYLEVHQSILTLLATQAPVATDLRLIAALLHVMKSVERMGDQCVNIAKVIPLTGHEPPRRRGDDARHRHDGPAGQVAGHPGKQALRRPRRRALPATWSARTTSSTTSTARCFAPRDRDRRRHRRCASGGSR